MTQQNEARLPLTQKANVSPEQREDYRKWLESPARHELTCAVRGRLSAAVAMMSPEECDAWCPVGFARVQVLTYRRSEDGTQVSAGWTEGIVSDLDKDATISVSVMGMMDLLKRWAARVQGGCLRTRATTDK